MNMLQNLVIGLLLSAFTSVLNAENYIGSNVAYMPKDEKAMHGLSEYEWDKVAGGDPVEDIPNPQVVKPSQLKNSEQYSYQCVLKAGDIRERIHSVTSCLGFRGGVWLLGELVNKADLTFGAETPEGVLQAIIEHFRLDATAEIYTNEMVAFKPRESL